MAVYVDPLIDCPTGKGIPVCFSGKQSCHMYADTLAELHDMAARVGLKRSWFQDKPTLKHYDLTPYVRMRAVLHGAVAQDRHQAVAKWKELRKDGPQTI